MLPLEFLILILCVVLLGGCHFPAASSTHEVPTSMQAIPTNTKPVVYPTNTMTTTANDWSLSHNQSKAKFQVFILNPVHTCLAGNDFASGNVCFGEKCGDCDCRWEDFDPPAPMTGITPGHIDDAQYADYAYRQCVTISLTEQEIEDIKQDMLKVAELVYEWSESTLELQVTFTEIEHDYAGFVAPDFVFGPFEVDDELLNP